MAKEVEPLDRRVPFEVVRRRRIWCPVYRHEVEVEFVEWGLPGFRDPVAVRSCSAFEEPTRITCARLCLDPSRRTRGSAEGWFGPWPRG